MSLTSVCLGHAPAHDEALASLHLSVIGHAPPLYESLPLIIYYEAYPCYFTL